MCEKLYSDGDNQCGINVIGMEGEEGQLELITECTDSCEIASKQSGEVDGYDPQSTGARSEAYDELENEAQAQLWIDCVDAATCDGLAKGDCQPHL